MTDRKSPTARELRAAAKQHMRASETFTRLRRTVRGRHGQQQRADGLLAKDSRKRVNPYVYAMAEKVLPIVRAGRARPVWGAGHEPVRPARLGRARSIASIESTSNKALYLIALTT
jgi:hypothetical protein